MFECHLEDISDLEIRMAEPKSQQNKYLFIYVYVFVLPNLLQIGVHGTPVPFFLLIIIPYTREVIHEKFMHNFYYRNNNEEIIVKNKINENACVSTRRSPCAIYSVHFGVRN